MSRLYLMNTRPGWFNQKAAKVTESVTGNINVIIVVLIVIWSRNIYFISYVQVINPRQLYDIDWTSSVPIGASTEMC